MRSTTDRRHQLLPLVLLGLAGCGGSDDNDVRPPPFQPPPPPPPLATGPASCVNGSAADFACDGIDLLRRVPYADMDGSRGNDLWGYFDASGGREYALVGMTDGTAFVDITVPVDPIVIGKLPTQTVASTWRDIKVYDHYAYVVADGAGAHGMQVFDLDRLRDPASTPQTFTPDAVYTFFENSHNLAINEATGYAYAVGTNTCGGGLHMIDIATPTNPLFAGCDAIAETHDTQCVVYDGPDAVRVGREICFSSNEDHFAIVDVTSKSSPLTLATRIYPELGFVHQGWLTGDHRYFLLGDEFDEIAFGVPTRTHVFDVTDLDAPIYLYAFEGNTDATDHNLYVSGNLVFEANYSSGLSVLGFGNLAFGGIAEVAFFDTYPAHDAPGLDGAWSVYPYLPSGTVIVSDQETGLFVLGLQ
ncbi:MAG TPA: choice-of-anchor B family protein [Gammaproteobacteria bacterium]|nr:choice-of-anchor B family protein [Gammaproteobacteria bacterium]